MSAFFGLSSEVILGAEIFFNGRLVDKQILTNPTKKTKARRAEQRQVPGNEITRITRHLTVLGSPGLVFSRLRQNS